MRCGRLDARLVAHVHELFGGDVASRVARVGRAADPADRRVEAGRALVHGGQHVGEREPARVVQVQCDREVPELAGEHAHHGGHLPRCALSRGVPDRERGHPGRDEAAGEFQHAPGRHRAFVGRPEGGRDGSDDAKARRSCELHDALGLAHGLLGPALDVALAAALAGRDEDRDRVGPRLDGPPRADDVRHGRVVHDSRHAVDRRHHVRRVGQLRDSIRPDEGRRVDLRQSGRREAIDEFGLVLSG